MLPAYVRSCIRAPASRCCLPARRPPRFGDGWETAPPDDTRPQCKQVRCGGAWGDGWSHELHPLDFPSILGPARQTPLAALHGSLRSSGQRWKSALVGITSGVLPILLRSRIHRQAWYQSTPELDADIAARFGPDCEALLAGRLDSWCGASLAALAGILLGKSRGHGRPLAALLQPCMAPLSFRLASFGFPSQAAGAHTAAG